MLCNKSSSLVKEVFCSTFTSLSKKRTTYIKSSKGSVITQTTHTSKPHILKGSEKLENIENSTTKHFSKTWSCNHQDTCSDTSASHLSIQEAVSISAKQWKGGLNLALTKVGIEKATFLWIHHVHICLSIIYVCMYAWTEKGRESRKYSVFRFY